MRGKEKKETTNQHKDHLLSKNQDSGEKGTILKVKTATERETFLPNSDSDKGGDYGKNRPGAVKWRGPLL